MKTYDEVISLLEESIKERNLTKMKDALKYCESTIYSSIGYAGPLHYAAECDFAEGVDLLLSSFYHDIVMGSDQRDRLWRIALFGWPNKVRSIVPILIEYNIIPSKHFLATLSSRIIGEKEETRDSIISLLNNEIHDIEFCAYYHNTDTISIRKKQIQD